MVIFLYYVLLKEEKTRRYIKEFSLKIAEFSKEMFTKMFSITGFTDVDQDAYKKVEATAKVMNVDLDKVK